MTNLQASPLPPTFFSDVFIDSLILLDLFRVSLISIDFH